MTFQGNVRATFFWRTFAKRTSLIALAATFITSLSIASESDPLSAYRDFFFMAILVGVVFYFTTSPPVNLFGGTRPWYRLTEIWRPILLGLIVVLSTMVVLFVLIGFPLAAGGPAQKFHDVLLWAIVVGFIEEYVRWTWLQTLPYSIVTANAVWVLLHPEVAVVMNGQSPSLFFAVFALLFGFMATAIMYLYETPLALGANRYMGPIMAAVVHAGFNALVVVWKVQIVVPAEGETLFRPMFAPVVVVLGLSMLIAGILRASRGRGGERGSARKVGT